MRSLLYLPTFIHQIKDDELSKELGRIDDALVLLEHDAARVQKSADAEEMRTSVPASRRKKEDRFYLQLRSPANRMLSTNREGARLPTFINWPGVKGGHEAPVEGNHLGIIALTWAYILSARWIELQETEPGQPNHRRIRAATI